MKKLFSIIILSIISQLSFGQDAQPFDVKVKGKGTPMLFIPGLSSSGEVWDESVEHFSNSYECHVFTLAGFAGTAPLKSEGFLPVVKTALIKYIEDLDKPVIIVGHSLGGFLSYYIGSERPELLLAAISVDGSPNTAAYLLPNVPEDQIEKQAKQMADGMKNQSPEQFKQYQPMIFKSMIRDPDVAMKSSVWGQTSDQKTVGQAMYELLTTNLNGDLANMNVPTLQMTAWAAYKPYGTTREMAKQLTENQLKNHPNIQLVIHDEAYHFIMLDEPEWFVNQIEIFLGNI